MKRKATDDLFNKPSKILSSEIQGQEALLEMNDVLNFNKTIYRGRKTVNKKPLPKSLSETLKYLEDEITNDNIVRRVDKNDEIVLLTTPEDIKV